MRELKPCPMCGAKDPVHVLYIVRRLNKHAIECERCHYYGKKAYTARGAIRKWNRIKVEGEER